MNNFISRRIFLGLHLIIGLLADLIFIPVLNMNPISSSFKSNYSSALLNSALILLTFFSLSIYLFIVLFFHYQLKYLMLLLVPFVGGIVFSALAFVNANKAEAADFKMNAKLWAFFSLLGLFALDQSSASIFTLWAFKEKLTIWQIMIDLAFLSATIFYFIYWGRNRGITKWSIKNLLASKWMILLGLILMIVWSLVYPAILSIFNLNIPIGDNQALINSAAANTPSWLMWLHLAIGAPVMEETIFRAGIYELLFDKQPIIAFFTSAISFAALHMLNGSLLDWRVWGIYLGMGFILSGVYYKTRKIESTVSLHFLWNGVWSYLSFFIG